MPTYFSDRLLAFPGGVAISDDLTEQGFEALGRNFEQVFAEMADILFEAIKGRGRKQGCRFAVCSIIWIESGG